MANQKLGEDLSSEKSKLDSTVAQLKKEQEAAARLREEVEGSKDRQVEEEQSGRIQQLEKRLQELETEQEVRIMWLTIFRDVFIPFVCVENGWC